MRRAPLLVPAVGVLCGIVADLHGVGAALAWLCVVAACYRRDLAIGGIAGLLVAALHGHPPTIEREGRTARYTGTVTSEVRHDDAGGVTFAFRVAGIGTLRAIGRESARAGERLVIRGRIEPLDDPRNPGEPSPRLLALDEGIVGDLSVARIIERAPPDSRDPTIWPALLRERASLIVRSVLPEPAATVLAGALYGERGTLPQSVRDDFQATGTVHVLVTAGLHLGVIAALVCALCGALRIPRVPAALATIPIVYGYAWLSGWHLPAQRAATMIAIALIARACGARSFSLNTLAAAAIVVAACWPVAVESVSYALSFSCVAAIVLFADPIRTSLETRRIPALVAEALALTVSTQIGVWPLTAAVFFSIAPYAVIANAVIVPLVGVTMVLGLAAIVSHPLAPVSSVFVRWDWWLLTVILVTTHALAALPGARMTMTPPPGWSLAAYDGCAIAAASIVRQRPIAAMLLLAAACVGVVLAANVALPGPFTVTVLDVGQGDGIVIRTPHRHTILIDTGGRLERGPIRDGESPAERSADRIVIPYLRRAGITRIDLMILTHPHGDHVGGFPGILRTMPVGWVADSGQRYGGHAYNDGLAEARAHRVPVIVPACHQRWVDDEVTFTFLSPCGPQFADGTNDVNENSLVVLVQYGTLRALFMGDAGFQSEERLLSQGFELHADILKVGHHGSAYSSSASFIEAVHPRFAIVSVGRHNPFGHPAPTTLETLRHAGASIFRTDQCGAVTIVVRIAARPAIKTMLSCVPATDSHDF